MEHFIYDLSIILVIAAVLSFIAVLLRQPIIIAYVLCGVIAGPWGMKWVQDVEFVNAISHLGIALLLFLAGLTLHPQKLFRLFRKTFLITGFNCVVSFGIGYGFATLFKFPVLDSLCIGMALMFSSTILAIKLLPTTTLHQERMGAICIGVLILQDLLAVAVLALIRCLEAPEGVFISFAFITLKLICFLAILVLLEQFVIRKMMTVVERFHELLFILGLAWCFGIATASNTMGLFYGTGAFFAGVILARHKIAFFISEKLKPLRDFFLVLFFFTLGAELDLFVMKEIFWLSLALAGIVSIIKPLIFAGGFLIAGEDKKFAIETGVRLGNLSVFSLLIAILALELGHISTRAGQLIQLTTILSFIISSYWVVFSYKTPIGPSEQLTKD